MLFRSSDPYGSRSPCGNQREHKNVLGTPKFIHVRRSTYCIVAQVNWGQHCNLWGNNCVSVTPSIPMRLISPYLLIFARLCTADWILYEADIRSLWVCCWQKDTRPFFYPISFFINHKDEGLQSKKKNCICSAAFLFIQEKRIKIFELLKSGKLKVGC